MNKNNLDAGNAEQSKESGNKYILSKFEYDLYHEEDDVSNPVFRVKKFSMPNKGEKWKIFLDKKVLFVIEGTKLNKKEKDYLNSINGFNFMLNQAKAGIMSFNQFKTELKKKINLG